MTVVSDWPFGDCSLKKQESDWLAERQEPNNKLIGVFDWLRDGASDWLGGVPNERPTGGQQSTGQSPTNRKL